MSYLVLARKYRPQNFDELFGQEVLVRTLQNAIRNNRLHHAYILSGIRGIGKTTSARIIAKTINCLDETSQKNATACGICDNCRLIAASKHQDVIEIDAASKTGVDDIREIIDSIAYAPVSSKYKIYIIDEIHMLSNSAFNALLKTLEEPPAHVKFIFATTEIKKVPVTVLSRCQRFDLRRLDEEEIVLHLQNILAKENLNAQKEGLEIIAKMSEGSVRDSLSLLDQALAINNHQENLESKVIENMLGLSDRAQVIALLEAIFKGDFNEAIKLFNEFYAYSSDCLKFLTEMMEILHKIISQKLIPSYKLQGYSAFQQDKIKEISKKIELNSLLRTWQMLSKGYGEINFSASQKMGFEILLAKLCHLVALPDLQQVLINSAKSENPIAEKILATNDYEAKEELINEILRNFEGSKVIENC